MTQNKPLTDKQQAFARHYVANGFNATQAAVSAGYSEDSAQVIGSENLSKPMVAEFIDQLKSKLNKKTTMTAERLAQMVNECLEYDLTEWFDVMPPVLDDTGKVLHRGGLFLKCALSELPESVRKIMVQGFKQTKFGVEVNLTPKTYLLDMQARFLSMYKDTLKVESPELTEEEKAALQRLKDEFKATNGG